MTDESAVRVTDNGEAKRYEISVDGALAGFSTYRDQHGTRVVLHTEVFPEFEHRGLAGHLAQVLLDDIRARGMRIVPRCPFIARYIAEHPEYADLVTT